MNVFLWVLQIALAVYFGLTGVMHFVVPPGLPAPMSWMYELPPGLHWISGGAEVLAALGLVLPGLTKIRPQLTPVGAPAFDQQRRVTERFTLMTPENTQTPASRHASA